MVRTLLPRPERMGRSSALRRSTYDGRPYPPRAERDCQSQGDIGEVEHLIVRRKFELRHHGRSAGWPCAPLLLTGALLLVSGGLAEVLAQSDLRRYEVDRADSHLFIVTGSSGVFGFLGHEHSILAREWSAELCTEESFPRNSHGVIVIETQALEIDSDSALALADFDRAPSDEDVREIQEKMLSREYLAADEYPEIRIETRALRQESPERIRAVGDITIRGVRETIDIPMDVEEENEGGFRLRGSTVVRQSDFGIEPESIFGVVRVTDEVVLNFLLTAHPTGQACRQEG